MAVATQNQQRELRPFRLGTRQRFAHVGTVSVSENGRGSIVFPRVGFLSHVAVQLDVTVKNTGAAAVTPVLGALGPWNFIRRLTFRINLGTATLYSTSGWSNYVLQRIMKSAYDPAGFGIDAAAAATTEALLSTPRDADLYNVSLASLGAGATRNIKLTYLLPIAANFGADFAVGLVNLQSPEVQANLDLDFGAVAGDMFGSSQTDLKLDTAASNVARVGYLYYEVPDPTRVQYPPLTFHRTIEDEVQIPTVGDVIYTVPRAGVVLRLVHTLLNNTPARVDDYTELKVRANRTDEFYRMERWAAKQLALTRYELPLPKGVFVHDWWAAQAAGDPGYGDTRDAISSEALSTLEDIVTLASGFTAGANAKLLVVREFLQFVAM